MAGTPRREEQPLESSTGHSTPLTDIVIIGEERIPVHKALLAARSPVFAAMFRHKDTKEAQEREVVISDVRAAVFKDLLQYLYTSVKPKSGRLTIELLALAHRFQVQRLKEVCEQHLATSCLSVITVPERLKAAHRCDAPALKESCHRYIAARCPEVVNTDVWAEFTRSGDMQLLLGALRAILESRQSGGEEEES